MIPLRPYQLAAIEGVRARLRGGKRRVIVVAPTGAGKTVIASHVIASAVARVRSVLFVAHRRELIAQAYNKLIGCTCSAAYRHDGLLRDPACLADGLPESEVGIVMAGDRRRRPRALVQVASIDTLRNRVPPPAELVIVDECHRALAASYRTLQDKYPNAVHIGLTATPYRADGKGLGEAYEDLVVVASPRILIGEGFLVEPRVFTVPAKDLPDLSRVRLKGGDYDQEQLEVAVDQVGLVGNIVEHWGTHARGMKTVCFAASVAHSQHIVERFVAAGVRAAHLDGTTPRDERDAILRNLELGELELVSNCGVLTEGWDQPSVKCAILARPTKSTGLYLQCAGRILRPYLGMGAVILDHAGVVLEHGLPQEDREFTLAPVKRREKQDRVPSVMTCDNCFACLPAGTRWCPECGTALTPEVGGVPLDEQPGQLVEVREADQLEKLQAWKKFLDQAKERGYSPGWASYRYKEKFGVWPPKHFPRPELRVTATDDTKRAHLDELRRQARDHGYRAGWVAARFKGRYGHDIPAAWMLPAQSAMEVAS